MVIHYVYSLSINNTPFYVGISCNPAKRLMLFHHDFNRKTKNFIDNVGRTKVSINILSIVRTESKRKCIKCQAKERLWINKLVAKGFDLKNTYLQPK